MKPDIWAYFDGRYKAHVEKEEDYDRLVNWSGCIAGGVYRHPGGKREWDIIVEEWQVENVRRVLQGKNPLRDHTITENEKARGKKYRILYPEKHIAHQAVASAVKSGKMKRRPCELCKSKYRVNGHHKDYSKPLSVRWLCPQHHSELHRGLIDD